MKKVGYMLILVGAILGPGYLVWAKSFSGSEIASSTILSRPAAAVRLEGRALSVSAGGEWEDPLEVVLTPEMGRISVIGEAEAFADPRRQRTFSVAVTAVSERGELWTDTVSFRSSRSSDSDAAVKRTSMSEEFHTFRVSEPGPVRFVTKRGRSQGLPVTSVSLSVRAGTHAPVPTVYGAGFGLVLLGFGALFLVDRRQKGEAHG